MSHGTATPPWARNSDAALGSDNDAAPGSDNDAAPGSDNDAAPGSDSGVAPGMDLLLRLLFGILSGPWPIYRRRNGERRTHCAA